MTLAPTEVCPSCTGTGLLCDDQATGHQVCTTDADCPRCDGSGQIPRRTLALAAGRHIGVNPEG